MCHKCLIFNLQKIYEGKILWLRKFHHMYRIAMRVLNVALAVKVQWEEKLCHYTNPNNFYNTQNYYNFYVPTGNNRLNNYWSHCDRIYPSQLPNSIKISKNLFWQSSWFIFNFYWFKKKNATLFTKPKYCQLISQTNAWTWAEVLSINLSHK